MTTTVSTSEVSAVDKAVWGFLEKQAQAAFIVAYPFFAIPFVAFFFNQLWSAISDQIFKVVNRFIVFAAIDFDDEQEQKAFDAAVANLNLTLTKPGATQDEINKASTDFNSALSATIHFN